LLPAVIGADLDAQEEAARANVDPSAIAPRTRLGRYPLLILLVFTASRLAYHRYGARFLDDHAHLWQFLDDDLLKHRLVESLYYLHSQPPGFNLFTGLVLKVAPVRAEFGFYAVFLLGGLAVYRSLFEIIVWFGVPRPLAFAVATWFAVSPAALLYESWMFYTGPVAALLVLSALALCRFLNSGRPRHAAFFCWGACGVCLLQSAFHLGWYLVLVTGLAAHCWQGRAQLLRAALPPLALLVGLYAKNALLFHSFTTSTWLGMNLAKVSLVNVPIERRRAMVERGTLSRVALVQPFSSLDHYPSDEATPARFASVPALGAESKSNGATNFNCVRYIDVSDQYLSDSIYVIGHDPASYLKGVAQSWIVYFKSTSEYGRLSDNMARIEWFTDLYERFFYGRWSLDRAMLFDVPGPWGRPFLVYPTLVVGLPFLMGFSLRFVAKRERGDSPQRRLVMAYIAFNVGYVALVGNFIESGENNRFRFMTDPLTVVVLAVALERLRRTAPMQALHRRLLGHLPRGSPVAPRHGQDGDAKV
jgi:hypothetical protein